MGCKSLPSRDSSQLEEIFQSNEFFECSVEQLLVKTIRVGSVKKSRRCFVLFFCRKVIYTRVNGIFSGTLLFSTFSKNFYAEVLRQLACQFHIHDMYMYVLRTCTRVRTVISRASAPLLVSSPYHFCTSGGACPWDYGS